MDYAKTNEKEADVWKKWEEVMPDALAVLMASNWIILMEDYDLKSWNCEFEP